MRNGLWFAFKWGLLFWSIAFVAYLLGHLGSVLKPFKWNGAWTLYSSVAGGFFAIHFFILRRWPNWVFTETLLHELTHYLFALITFQKLEGLDVNREGGSVAYRGESNFISTLAPYIIPPIFTVFWGLSFLVSKQYALAAKLVLLITYCWFLARTFQPNFFIQPDLKRYGYIFSLIMVLVVNLQLFFFVMCMLQGRQTLFTYWIGRFVKDSSLILFGNAHLIIK